ncbi:MAG: hydroxymethylbilane synthase [Planctomycetaceae bacterium]|nr:hydroxymethylbilane synthase [Planctomycetaceae bacterium]
MIRLGTRNSQLALWQSTWVADQLRSRGFEVELVPLTTEGDVATGPLRQLGGEGLFTKRLQIGLQNREIDLAVHSLKDLPTEPVTGLELAAVPEREDVRDAFVSNSYVTWSDLPQHAKVGTGSLRRAAQLRWLRPDLEVVDLRGNVDTRLRKLDEGHYDAIVLACAGLRRLGLEQRITQALDLDTMLSAVGQGALGLEVRCEDIVTRDAVRTLNDVVTLKCVQAERAFLNETRAGCTAPVAAHAVIRGEQLYLQGAILSESGQQRLDWQIGGHVGAASELGRELARQLLSMGGREILANRS